MENYKKKLIEEHSQLVVRIEKLHNWVYSDQSNVDNKVEFANKCVQLAAMTKYEEALRARIENTGITFENGNYFERVASITPVVAVTTSTEQQSDGECVTSTEQQSDGK